MKILSLKINKSVRFSPFFLKYFPFAFLTSISDKLIPGLGSKRLSSYADGCCQRASSKIKSFSVCAGNEGRHHFIVSRTFPFLAYALLYPPFSVVKVFSDGVFCCCCFVFYSLFLDGEKQLAM